MSAEKSKEERTQMENKYEKAIQITIKVAPSTYKSLQKLAAKNNRNMSDVVRGFIDKGMTVDGYKDDINLITGLIRQTVHTEMEMTANRLEKMMFKMGIISASNYFLAVRMLSDVISPSMQEDFKEINTRAREIGLEYMNMSYPAFRSLMENEEGVTEMADRIRRSFQDEY